MSRRYPRVAECETCGAQAAARADGEQRPHTCWVQWNGDRVPWPWQYALNAASKLGVSVALLEGLMNQGHGLRGVKVVRVEDVGRPNAESRYVFNRADVQALKARMLRDRIAR